MAASKQRRDGAHSIGRAVRRVGLTVGCLLASLMPAGAQTDPSLPFAPLPIRTPPAPPAQPIPAPPAQAPVVAPPADNAVQSPPAKMPKPTPAPNERAKLFLIARGTDLYRGKLPFHNVGVSAPDLFAAFLHGKADAARSALRAMRATGARFVRCAGTATRAEDFALFQTDRARWFAAFDQMLAAADDTGIALVPSLLYRLETLPEAASKSKATTGGGQNAQMAKDLPTATRSAQIAAYFTPGSAANTLALDYVSALAARYCNDPRILFWEIGDGYNRAVDAPELAGQPSSSSSQPASPTSAQLRAFLIEMATRIKSLDKRHLVASGCDNPDPTAWHRSPLRTFPASAPITATTPDATLPAAILPDTFLEYSAMLDYVNPAPLDLITIQQRPFGPDNPTPYWLTEDTSPPQALAFPWARRAAEVLKRPLFVAAFGEPVARNGQELPAAWTVDFLRRMQSGTAPLAALASWPIAESAGENDSALSPARTPVLLGQLTGVNGLILRALAELSHSRE